MNREEALAKLNEARREALKCLHDTQQWEHWDVVFRTSEAWLIEQGITIEQDHTTGEWFICPPVEIYVDGELMYSGTNWREAFFTISNDPKNGIIRLYEKTYLIAEVGAVHTRQVPL